MLTATRQSDNAKVSAWETEKTEAPFFCPQCQSELTLHKGRIKIHHFAHKPQVSCPRGAGETQEHLRAKMEIFNALRNEPNVSDLELEKDFGISVADVYARISGTPVAVEIQRSRLTVKKITSRTQNYNQLGIAVLWAGLPTYDQHTEKYSPRAWEKWCHAAYYGRVYYWLGGQAFQPVHFSTYSIYVNERTWYEDGVEKYAGGYSRVSKRWSTLQFGHPAFLSSNFHKNQRPAWSKETTDVPECSIYIDKQDRWWKRRQLLTDQPMAAK